MERNKTDGYTRVAGIFRMKDFKKTEIFVHYGELRIAFSYLTTSMWPELDMK